VVEEEEQGGLKSSCQQWAENVTLQFE